MGGKIESYIRSFSHLRDVYLEPEVEEKLDMHYLLDHINCWDKDAAQNLVRSLASLTNELKEELPYYDSIISDDASGRLISLFFRKIINKKREGLDKEPASTYFIAPRRGAFKETNTAIDNFITKRINPKDKVLVVTEHIDTGASLAPITKSLEKQKNVEYDIASISVNQYFKLPEDLNEKVKYVSKSKDGLLLHNSAFTGVKSVGREMHPKKREGEDTQRFLKQAREEISIIADEISSIF